MKIHKTYECEKCGNRSNNPNDIELCEAQHKGLNNIEDYRQWKLINDYAAHCTGRLSTENNEHLCNLEDEAYTKLFAFEKEHNMVTK